MLKLAGSEVSTSLIDMYGFHFRLIRINDSLCVVDCSRGLIRLLIVTEVAVKRARLFCELQDLIASKGFSERANCGLRYS